MLVAGILLAIAGFTIVLLARHGFMVGTHPFCSACNFNLTGLPEKHARCPECGADILREGSVRIGYRRPVFAGVAAGAVIALAGAVCLAGGAVSWWQNFDASRWKPVTVLEAEMAAPRAATRELAYRELLRRIQAGALSAKQINQLADMVLKRQADPAVPWDPRCGDLLQAARQQRLLASPTWEQYLRQAMRVTASVRPRIEAHAPRAFRVGLLLQAGSDNQGIAPGSVGAEMEVTTEQGAKMQFALDPTQRLDVFSEPLEWINLATPDPTPGIRKVHVRAKVTLTDVAGAQVTKETEADLAYEILPPGTAAVTKHVATPDETSEMQTAVRLQLPAEPLRVRPDQSLALGSLMISGPPVSAGFRIVLRQKGREWTVARVLIRANEGTRVRLDLPPLREGSGPEAGAAEIVCVPEPALAGTSADIMEVWGEEVRRPVVLTGP